MPDQPTTPTPDIVIPDTAVEVQKPVLVEGKSKFGNFSGPTPARMKRVGTALQKMCVGFIGAVSVTDLFTGLQAKKINFILTCVIIFIEAILYAWGVETTAQSDAKKP